MDNKIVVICLEYGGPAGVKLSTTFSHKLAPNLSHWAIFMTDEYVGVLECSPDTPADGKEECIRLVAFNLKTGRQATIHTDMSGKVRLLSPLQVNIPRSVLFQDFALSHSGTSTIDGDVFILLEDKKQARITRIPKHYLPHDDNSDCPTVSTLKWEDNSSQYDIVPQDENDEFTPEGALSANDFYRAPAVSLHAVRDELRNELVPLNRKYPIAELLEACRNYPGVSNAKRITFEYVMLKDKNDSDDHARELVRLIRHYRLPAKVNLIPFNPWPGAVYECSTPERIRSFSNIVFEGGISAPVRTPRGRDIDAACGQLKTAAEKKRRSQLDAETA